MFFLIIHYFERPASSVRLVKSIHLRSCRNIGLSMNRNKYREREENTMQAKQEKWDLYDQQGRKTGKTIQAGENVPYGYCLYCVGIWVIDSEKKILLTKRSSQKRYAPGKWENTGGHMISGETSRHAIVRELKEETGIQIEEDELIELGDNHIGQFLGDNYAVFKDVALDEVHLEEGETEDVIKVTLPQLEEMAEKKMLSPAVWDHMAGYKDEFYRLFD